MSSAARSRPTAVTPSLWPNFSSTRSATILRVHKPKSNPYWRLATDPAAQLMPLALTQRRRPAGRRARLQRRVTTLAVRAQPRIDRRAAKPIALHHRARCLSLKHAIDRHPPDRFGGIVCQCASVDFHESERNIFQGEICRVNCGLASKSDTLSVFAGGGGAFALFDFRQNLGFVTKG